MKHRRTPEDLMSLQDLRTGLETLLHHAEGLLAEEAAKPAVVADVDHIAAFIADAGLGPAAGSLVAALVADVVQRADALELEHPLGGAPEAPAEPAPAAEAPAEAAQVVPAAPAVSGAGT